MNKKKGVLLVNLGSPNSPEVKDVKSYLKEFLMDGKVIDMPFLLRFLLVKGIIVPFRAKKSSKAYKKIWWEEGSPLVVYSKKLQAKIAQKTDAPVELAMRYGNPSIEEGFRNLQKNGVNEVLIFPLYPQYAMSTTETVEDKCLEVNKKFHFNLTFEPPFYNQSEYIDCLVNSIKPYLKEDLDTLLFSYHGIPERHIYKTDKTDSCKIGSCCFKDDYPSHPTCYRHQCYKTTELVREKLNYPKGKTLQSFQSRLGKDPWLQPYTQDMLENLPLKQKKKIAVLAPAFVSDCLETLEELAIEGKESFLHAGGESFQYIPCLNLNEDWIEFIFNRISKFL